MCGDVHDSVFVNEEFIITLPNSIFLWSVYSFSLLQFPPKCVIEILVHGYNIRPYIIVIHIIICPTRDRCLHQNILTPRHALPEGHPLILRWYEFYPKLYWWLKAFEFNLKPRVTSLHVSPSIMLHSLLLIIYPVLRSENILYRGTPNDAS